MLFINSISIIAKFLLSSLLWHYGSTHGSTSSYEIVKPGFTLTSTFVSANSVSHFSANISAQCLAVCSRDESCQASLFSDQFKTCDLFTVTPNIVTDYITKVNDKVHIRTAKSTTCPTPTTTTCSGLTLSPKLTASVSVLPSGLVLSSLSLIKKNLQIKCVDPAVFRGLTNLATIDLETNSISILPKFVFRGLISLTRLEFGVNSLTEMPVGLFWGLTQLTYIRFYVGGLICVPSDTFSGLSLLTELHLSNHLFTSLPESLFRGLISLRTLILSTNQLTSLPASMFTGLTSLAELYVYSNPLTTLNGWHINTYTTAVRTACQCNVVVGN